jgi:hypothetical protein
MVARRQVVLGAVGALALLATGLAVDQLTTSRGPDEERWAITVGAAMSGYCLPSDDDAGRPCGAEGSPEDRCYETAEDDAAVEACLQGLGDPDSVTEFHLDRFHENDEVPEVDACLQRMVDDGELGADVLAEFRCTVVYESLSEDISDEEYARAGEVFERCMVDAGSEPGVVASKGSGPPEATG